MRALLVLSALTSPAFAEPFQLELGGINSPQGNIGMRTIARVGPADTGIAIGGGLGLTGFIATAGIDQPIHREKKMVVSLYASYALATLRPWSRTSLFSAADDIIVDGRYHWIDAGVVVRYPFRGRFFFGGGAGVAILVAHPDPIGREQEDEKPYLWFFSATGWTRVQNGGPAIWTCAGVEL